MIKILIKKMKKYCHHVTSILNMIINKKIIYVDFEYSGFDEISKFAVTYTTEDF